jgi:hypothetical protein
MVWVTVRVVSSSDITYDPAGEEIDYGAQSDGQRLVRGIYGGGQPRPPQLDNGGWITLEADVYGSDSIIHYVEGDVIIKYRNPRVAPRDDPNNVEKYLSQGLIAWQSEGTEVQYRDLKIKLMEEDSLYLELYSVVGCKDPGDPAYDPMATVHDSSMCQGSTHVLYHGSKHHKLNISRVKNRVLVKLPVEGDYHVSVSNTRGEAVVARDVFKVQETSFSTKTLAPGMYIVLVHNGRQSYSGKFMVLK